MFLKFVKSYFCHFRSFDENVIIKSKILPWAQISQVCSFCLTRNLVGECLPQTLHVVASSISLALPKSAGLAHFAAPPFPHKVLRLCGDPLFKMPMYQIWYIGIFMLKFFRAGCLFSNLSVTETKTGTKAQQSNCRKCT